MLRKISGIPRRTSAWCLTTTMSAQPYTQIKTRSMAIALR